MELTTLLLFAGALCIAAGSPGPSIAALVARVIARGHGSVWPFLAAMWVGEAIWLTLAVFGLAVVAQTFHLAFVVLKWAGVAYLLYLAWTMWRSAGRHDEASIPHADSPMRLFMSGMAITLGNPKIMVFYVALLPTIVDLTHVTIGDWAALTLTMFVVLIAIDVAWMLAAMQARRLLRSPRAVKLANRISAGTMAGAAAVIAARAD